VENLIRTLEEALAQIQQQIESHLNEYVHLRADANRLRQVPGIGAKNVLPILVLLYRWHSLTGGRGTAKGLTAYVGIDPKTFESGTTVRRTATISRFGNPRIRQLLYMGALGSSRGNNCLRQFSYGFGWTWQSQEASSAGCCSQDFSLGLGGFPPTNQL
jgi:transposase